MRKLSVAALLAACALSSPAEAQQPPLPVHLEVGMLFGPDVVRPRAWAPVLVTMQNRTQRAFQGQLQIEVKSWRSESVTQETRVDLPAGSSRQVIVDVYLPEDGSELRTRYVTGGGIAGRTTFTAPYSSGGPGIVVLARESRLRSVLGEIDSSIDDGYGSVRQVNMPVGTVAFDAATGDPLAPITTHGYAPVSLVIARSSELEALSPAQREALRKWVGSGGRLFVFPRTPEAVQQPFLRSLIGEVTLQESAPVTGRFAAVPTERQGVSWSPADETDWVDEAFGGSRRLGFGRVYLATYDGTVPPHVDGAYTRSSLRAVARVDQTRVREPMFAFGEQEPETFGWGGNTSGFQELRAALDPNESFRPALGFVAILLLFYVILVGPVNFRWVAKKNRPIFALITTPIAALSCLMLMLIVGYIGKGVTMRYRSVEVVETAAGQPLASSREYLSLFLTRPTSFDFDDGLGTRLLHEGSPRMPLVRTDGLERRMENLQGGLWQTLFLRRDRVRDLGGGVSFEVEDLRLVGVRNGTGLPLTGGILIAPGGRVYTVGDIPAGGRAAIGGQPVTTLTEENWYYGPSSPETRSLARSLGIDTEEGRKTLYGLISLAGNRVQANTPLFFARIEESAGELAGRFSEEQTIHLLRVVVPNIEPMVHINGSLGGALDEVIKPDPLAEPMMDTPHDLFDAVGGDAP